MEVQTKVVALRNELPSGTTLTIEVEENDKGYKGLAFPVYSSGKKVGYVYQDPKFAEAGCLGIADIIDALGEDNVIDRSWTATVVQCITQANGRPLAYINFDIPEMGGKEVKKMPTTKATAAATATTLTGDTEKYRIYAQSMRNNLSPEAHEVRFSAELLHKPDKPIPVTFEKAADGRIGVVIKDITVHPAGCKDKTLTKNYKDVVVGYVKDEPITTETEASYRSTNGRQWVPPDSLWRMLTKRKYEATIEDTQQLVVLCLNVDVEPDSSHANLLTELAGLGLSTAAIKAKMNYLQTIGAKEEDQQAIFQHYIRMHKDHPLYQPENVDYTYIPVGKEALRGFKSFIRSRGTIYVGASGTGKDTYLDTLCRWFNIRSIHQVADANMDADILVGMQGIENDNGVGVTAFQPSVLMELLSQPAGEYLTLFILDEANMADPGQFVVLNELLNQAPKLDFLLGKSAEGDEVVSFTRGGDRVVSPWFRMALTMNVDLEGCKAFNQATWTRMDTIVFKQGLSMKDILLKEYPSLSVKDAKLADRLWNAILKEAKNSGDEEVNEVGPRNFKSAARDVLIFGTSMKEALADTVLDKIQVEETRTALEKILESF